MKTRIVMIAASAVLAGCATTTTYQRGEKNTTINHVDIAKPRAEVWKAAVPALARQFFVINNMDQSSGLINLSYSGDPERYVDCGTVSVTYPGRQPVNFPGARADQSYDAINPGIGPYTVHRRMQLEGRVNLIFEETAPNTTRVTANTRYILNREVNAVRSSGSPAGNLRHTISFNTNQSASFPAAPSAPDGVECNPTGQMEREILQLIR